MPLQANDAAPIDWPLVERAFGAGDAQAAAVVVSELAPLVEQLVRRLSAWRADVDDLVQDVLVAVLENRSRFRGDSMLRTWITRIAVNQCRAQRRKQWLRQKLWSAWAVREPRPQMCAVGPDAGVDAAERRSAVRAAIAKLPASHREAVVLHYLENLSVTETAAVLRVRRGTVEVRLSRARAQLRDLLPELAGDAGEYLPEGGDD